jgi:REP element-mobilizing transposase RayT
MSNRKVPFVNGEIYHIFNRGVDKQNIYKDEFDLERFFQSLMIFNFNEPVGSLYEKSFLLDKSGKLEGQTLAVIDFYRKNKNSRLVEFICYCLNPNHFHLVVEQKVEGGVSELMKRIGGYTYAFNEKYKRNGSLFQGTFKSVHVEDNTQLLHLSAYVNLNNKFGDKNIKNKLSKSSWLEYKKIENKGICEKDIILKQFKSDKGYVDFAEGSLKDILLRKNNEKEMMRLLID